MVSGQDREVQQNAEGLVLEILCRPWLMRFKLTEELRWDWRRSRSYLQGEKMKLWLSLCAEEPRHI